jgi:prepilin-type N-terminal cleavage/methylation domain-containing protein
MMMQTRRTGDAGFTMVELMMVIVIIGILATVASVSYAKYARKANSSEVSQIFGELKTREEAYHAENGAYLSACASPGTATPTTLDCAENDFWPAALPGKGKKIAIGTLPASWSALKVAPGKASLYCQYSVVSGSGGFAVSGMGALGQSLYATDPLRDWYYLVARCDWDGDPATNSLYWQRGDMAELYSENDGR